MITNLIKYQETDKRLKEIEDKLAKSEEKKKAAQAFTFLSAFPDSVAKLDKKAEELINQLSSVSSKKQALSEQLKDISEEIENIDSEESAHYTIKKADELMSAIKALDETINKLSQAMSAVKTEYDKAKISYVKAKEQYTEFGEKYNELKKSVKTESDLIKTELEKIKKTISEDLMRLYENKRKDKFPPLVMLNGNKCGACGMEISMKGISDLNNGALVECDNCHKLVYKQ